MFQSQAEGTLFQLRFALGLGTSFSWGQFLPLICVSTNYSS